MIEQVQDLQIGEVTLDGVLAQPEVDRMDKIRLEEIKGLTREIKRAKRPQLAMEKLPLVNLNEERVTLELKLNYPLLDVSFLKMSNIIRHRGQEIYVPRFSVYPIDKNQFSINFLYPENEVYINVGVLTGMVGGAISGMIIGASNSLGAAICGGFLGAFSGNFIGCFFGAIPSIFLGEKLRDQANVTFPDLPDIFTQQIIKSIEFSRYSKPRKIGNRYLFGFKDIPMDTIDKYKRLGEVTLASYLYGLVPEEKKQRIEDALEIFSRKDLYLIAETKPEDWNVKKLIRDPVVVGIREGKCFYIDKFNTAPLEEYVTREFNLS